MNGQDAYRVQLTDGLETLQTALHLPAIKRFVTRKLHAGIFTM